jgi:hypothetical protein
LPPNKEAILQELGLGEADVALIQAYREQGASLADVNNQLLLRQSLPPDLQTPEVLEAFMGDRDALNAVLSNPEALATFEREYRAALQSQSPSPYFDQSVPQTGYYAGPQGLAQAGDVMTLLTQPINPVNSRNALNQSADFYRSLALAGGDWRP